MSRLDTILPPIPSAGSTDEFSHAAEELTAWNTSEQLSGQKSHQDTPEHPHPLALTAEEEQQFIWLGILAKNATFTAKTAAILWECAVEEAELLLQHWMGQQILMEQQWPQANLSPFPHIYQLPVALQQIAYRRLLQVNQLEPQEAHGILIKRYQAFTHKRLWHTLEDDGYIHAHLTWHLQAAKRCDEIHILLQEEAESGANGWYEACDRMGYTSFFCRDVLLAWKLAENLFEHSSTLAIQLQCRYALMQVAHHRAITAIPSTLVAAFVQKQVWTATQGMTYLELLPPSQDQFEILQKLIPVLPPSYHPFLLTVIKHQPDDRNKAQLLCALAPVLRTEQLQELLTVVQSMPTDFYKALVLREIAISLPTHCLDQTMAIAQSLAPDEALIAACGIVARWPQTLSISLPQLIQAAKESRDETLIAELFSTVLAVSQLSLSQVQELLGGIQDPAIKVDLLIQLLPQHPQFLSRAFQTACNLDDERSCEIALAKLSPYLSEVEVLLAIKILDQFKDTSASHPALKAISIHHNSPKICTKLMQVIKAWSSEHERGQAYSQIFPHLPTYIQAQIKAQVSSFSNEITRILCLCHLAVADKKIFSSALHQISQCPDQTTQFKAYWILLQHWPKLIPAAFNAACHIPQLDAQIIAIHQLAPHLSDEQLTAVLNIAQQIKDGEHRQHLLNQVIPYCSQPLLGKIQLLVSQQPNHQGYADVLSILKAQSTSPEIRLSTWDARQQALQSLTSFLPDQMLKQTLSATFEFENQTSSAKSLSQLLPQIHPSQVDHGLWCRILRTLAHLEYDPFLKTIPKLMPIMGHLAGTEILHGTIQNIEMVGRQW